MTPLARRRLRWTVPAVVVAVVLGGAALSGTSLAASSPNEPLAPRTAQQLLAEIGSSSVTALSGTVDETVKLGLPALPSTDPGSGSDLSLQSLVSGSHTARVWVDGPLLQRIAVLGQLSESDVVHNGRDVWTYDSQSLAVTHLTLPARHDRTTTPTPEPTGPAFTPASAAAQLLTLVDPSTSVTVGTRTVVAGREAYRLVLTPRDSRTTIGRIEVAVDADTSVPLGVAVYARGAGSPAVDLHFSSVSFTTPSASVFAFTPPPGSTVKQVALPTSVPEHDGTHRPGGRAGTGAEGPRTIGTGWTTVVELPAGGGSPAAGPSGGPTAGLLNEVATPVPGGRLVTSALFSVLVTDTGAVYVAAVSGADLQQVAATGQPL